MTFTKKLDEFLNGGNSRPGEIGKKVGSTISITAKILCLTFIVLFLVGVGQLGQIMYSVKDLRIQSISDWSANNPSQSQVASDFLETCLNGKLSDINKQRFKEHGLDKEPISIYECGINLGATDLVEKIKIADSTLKSLAWPLSILN